MTETPLDRTAIDTVLIKLNLGCQYMEITRPSKADVKKAAEAAKDAADILKACIVLLDHDIYVVQEAPQGPGTPLFKASGEPTAAAEVPTETGLRTMDAEIVRKFKVGDRVKATATCIEEEGTEGTVLEDDGSDEDESPYFVQFTTDGENCGSYNDAKDLEMVEAAPELTADQKTMAEPFPKGTKAQQKAVFGERLAILEEIFCQHLDLAGSTATQSAQLKQFRPHRDAWVKAWKGNAKATWLKLLAAIVEANTLSNDFTAWAPQAAA